MSKKTEKETLSGDAKRKIDFGSFFRRQGLLLMLILMIIFFRFQSPEYFFTFDNAITILVGATALGIMASAQTPLIISGGIDVSVGSVVALTTVIVGKLLATGMSSWLVVLIAIWCQPLYNNPRNNVVFLRTCLHSFSRSDSFNSRSLV
jgi:ribose/xylose/arabinose/galactoside ABC-type transport system permease subunit